MLVASIEHLTSQGVQLLPETLKSRILGVRQIKISRVIFKLATSLYLFTLMFPRNEILCARAICFSLHSYCWFDKVKWVMCYLKTYDHVPVRKLHEALLNREMLQLQGSRPLSGAPTRGAAPSPCQEGGLPDPLGSGLVCLFEN